MAEPAPPQTTGSVPDDELVRRAIKARLHASEPLYSRVCDLFDIRPSEAKALCDRFGFDPEELMA